jgi:hypothetical protein
MSDDDSTESQPEAAPDAPAATAPTTSPAPERSGVHVPTWVAATVTVVLAFLIGVAGFAIGRTTADDGHRFERPAFAGQGPGGRGPDGQMPGGRMPGGQGPGGQMPGGRQGGPGIGGQDGGGPQGGPGIGGQGDGGGNQAPSAPDSAPTPDGSGT